MKVEAILIANSAVVGDDNLLYVQGGAWGYVEREQFPTTVKGDLAFVLALEPDDLNKIHALSAVFSDSAGHVEPSNASMILNVTAQAAGDAPQRNASTMVFQSIVSGPTVGRVVLLHEGGEIAAVEFDIREPAPDAV